MPTHRKTSNRRAGQPITAAERAAAQDTFLRVFAERGIVIDAAAAANISRAVVYDWRAKDPAFRARYDLAEADANDHINQEIWRRGVVGWDEVQIIETTDETGETTRVETKRTHHFSDTMLRLIAQARMPHLYRDRMDLTTNDEAIGASSGTITQIINDPAAAQLACDLLATTARAGRADTAGGDAGGPGVPGE